MDALDEGAPVFRELIVGRLFVEIPAGLAPAHLLYTRVLVVVRLVLVISKVT
jgi:hypothetical protein